MRRSHHSNFILAFILTLLFNLEGLIPALILLALHFLFGISLWWSAGALALWIGIILLRMLFLSWAGRCSRPDPPKKNKNPHSSGPYKPQ